MTAKIRLLLVCACAGSALMLPESAVAREYYFFNKPGVTRKDYLSDRLLCDQLAGGSTAVRPDMTAATRQIWQNPNLSTGQAAAAAGITSFMLSFVQAAEQRRMVRQIERICLADKGYRRFEMNKDAYKVIENVEDDALRIDGWFQLASSVEPLGKEMPE
jgi:hypothetical protein